MRWEGESVVSLDKQKTKEGFKMVGSIESKCNQKLKPNGDIPGIMPPYVLLPYGELE